MRIKEEFSDQGSGADLLFKKNHYEVLMPAAPSIVAYSSPVTVKLNEEFKLKTGQYVFFKEEDLKINFISVIKDNRILNEFSSVLNGNAEVLLIISNEGREIEACLSTDKESKSVVIKNFRIILKNLIPYPSESRIIFNSRYTATFLIKKIKENVYS